MGSKCQVWGRNARGGGKTKKGVNVKGGGMSGEMEVPEWEV